MFSAKFGSICSICFKGVRLKYENMLTDGRRTPSDGNTSHDPLGQVS
jgi:hypothetical protein